MKKTIILWLCIICIASLALPVAACQAAAQRILLMPAQEYSPAGSPEMFRQIDTALAQNFNYPLNAIVPHYEMLPSPPIPSGLKPQSRSAKLPKEFLQTAAQTASADLVVIPQLLRFSHSITTDLEGDSIQETSLVLRCFVYTAPDDRFSVIETSRYYHDDYAPGQEPQYLLEQMLWETKHKLPYGVIVEAQKHGVQ